MKLPNPHFILKHTPNRFFLSALLCLCGAALVAGCGGTEEWPSSANDYAQVKGNRGLAMVWGVIIDIESAGTDPISVTQTGTLGKTPEQAFAEKELIVNDVQIRIKADGSEQLQLSVNDKNYGFVLVGHQVKVTEERQVLVNGDERKGK